MARPEGSLKAAPDEEPAGPGAYRAGETGDAQRRRFTARAQRARPTGERSEPAFSVRRILYL
jgi:hypothetical protein